MASKSIGSIYAELTLKDNMSGKLKTAQKSLKSFAAGASGAAGTAAAAFAAIATSLAVVGKAVSDVVNAGGELNDMMARTGANGEGLMVMQRAFENAGLAASDVPNAINKMQKSLMQGGAAFDRLGLSVYKLQAEDPTKAFEDISRAIAQIKDPAERTKVAMDIFGKSGGKMLAVFTDASAFDLAKTQVGGLGKILSDHVAELDAAGDAWGSLKTKWLQIGSVVAVELLPAMENLNDSINNVDFTNLQKGFSDTIGAMEKQLPRLQFMMDVANPAQFLGGQALRFAAAHGPSMEGTALKGPDVMLNGDGSTSPLAPKGEYMTKIKPLWERAGEMFAKKATEVWEGSDFGVPEMLQNPDKSTYDIPSWLRKRDQNQTMTPWETSNYATNDFQARGLALSGVNSTKENKNTTLLSDIRDLLKAIERKRAGEFVYP